MVTTGTSASVKLYGPWMRAEHYGNLLFLNFSEKEDVAWKSFTSRKERIHKEMVSIPNPHYLCDRLRKELDKGAEATVRQKKFQNFLDMCHELAALNYTLEMQDLEGEFDL